MPTYPIANRLVPVNQIHPNPDQPRKDFDPESLKELQDSIKQRGLINPIAVCEMKNAPSPLMGEGGGGMNPPPQSSPARGEDGPHYMIIAGERRWRAYQALGLPEIDCRIWPAGTPTEEVELLSLTENLQRNDLNPIEEAKGYEVLTKAPYNQTQEDIAKAVGKPQSAISETIKLLNQPVEIRDFIARAIISPRHTRHLARIEDEKERIKWSKKAGQEGWSVKETEKRVNQLLGEGKQPHPASGHPLPKGESRGEADPLASLWPSLMVKARDSGISPWLVKYGLANFGIGKGSPAWTFHVLDSAGGSRGSLGKWFRVMAEVIDPLPEKNAKNAGPAEYAAPSGMGKSEGTEYRVGRAFGIHPATEPYDPDSKDSFLNPRLPADTAERTELEALVPKGPAAAFRWIFGAQSKSARWLDGVDWSDLKIAGDAKSVVDQLIKLVEAHRQAAMYLAKPKSTPPLKHSAAPPRKPVPAPTQAAVSSTAPLAAVPEGKKPLDPRLAAMLERRLAKRRL